MRKRDLRSNIKVMKAMNAAIASDTTTSGSWIDTKGYDAVTFALYCQARAALVGTPIIRDSDNAAHSDAAAVDDTFLIGTEAGAVIDAADEITTIGYSGKKRWVQLQILSTAAGTMTVAAVAILSHAAKRPLTQGVGA